MLGLSQEKLGNAMDLTFQQVQKYERGTTRISASRLFVLSRVLDVPVSFFFDDRDPVHAPPGPSILDQGLSDDPMRQQEAIELIDALFQIENANTRRHLLNLVKSLATGEWTPADEC
jgi:transcriptional regulator with XRE-family HTH domain